MRKRWLTIGLSLLYLNLFAQEQSVTVVELSGQVMTDVGYNFDQINPDYYDVMRPTQLPAYKDQYAPDGTVYFGVRQSMLDFKSFTPTRFGELTTRIAFDLFGVGSNAGQTTFHLLYAYAELGKFGVGHTWSLFCDFDGFPLSIDYWGPTGMSLCKNVQIRFIPFKGDNRLAFAIERPGASADEGVYRDRIELSDVKPKFDLPDFSGEFRMTRNWGYAELAGIVRKIEWVDLGNEPYDLSGKAIGWGINLSTNLKFGKKSFFIGQALIGQGVQNYMNDAPTDIAIKNNFSDVNKPIKGVALPLYSYSAYINHWWNEKFSSIIGYSAVVTDNTDGQHADAFHEGSYASTNILYYPVAGVMAGLELQWFRRENFDDGWETSATKIQFSFRYFFKKEIKSVQ